jgi:hypothetical protein
MPTGRNRKGTRFVVDLGNLRLPTSQEKAIDTEIRRAVMRSLAEVDFSGNVRIKFPPNVYGMILDSVSRRVPKSPQR